MAFLVSHPHDCSIPYKKFQELTNNDFIYLIDFKNLSLEKYEIKDVKVEKVNEWDDRKNCFEVKFIIIGFDRDYEQRVSDGNCFIYPFYSNGEGRFFTTDERIGNSILDIIRQRNHYQWGCLTGIFGSPLNKYAARDIKLH